MRLLNTKTKKLETFQGQKPPKYAILSHVWEEEEVSFQDITSSNLASVTTMKGFAKIEASCQIAAKDGFRYIWIDTCCINKESSAELSEAINSMFSWYKNSHVCYVFLSDVPSDEDPSPSYSSFAMSKWFTRGWTLQELLAPLRVIFYGRDWIKIGMKTTLQKTITAVTGIEERIILEGGIVQYEDIPIAIRMSWAAERQTTRVEDMAYCLMGLFNVNMPLLYGEGRKAFIRLQHEIIRKSNDHSIFAWKAERVGRTLERGLLARSPSEFYDSNKISAPREIDHDDDYTITNRGIRIKMVIHRPKNGRTVARLNCLSSGKIAGVHLMEKGRNQYVRVYAHDLLEITPQDTLKTGAINKTEVQTLFVLDDVQDAQSEIPATLTFLKILPSPEYGDLDFSYHSSSWDWVGPTKWHFVSRSSAAGDVFATKNVSKMEQCAVAVGVMEGLVWADVFTGFKFGATAGEVYTSYFGTQRYSTPRKFCRVLDGPSVDLPSGWTAHLHFKDVEISLNGEVQLVTLHFRKTTPINPRGIPWKRPSSRSEVIYLITCSALQHYFTIAGEDQPQVTPYGYWPPGSSRSLIVGATRSAVIPFKKSPASPGIYFFLVLEGNLDGLFRSSIEIKKPGMVGDLLRLRGTADKLYSVPLGRGEVVSVTIRRSRDTSLADFIINVSLQDSSRVDNSQVAPSKRPMTWDSLDNHPIDIDNVQEVLQPTVMNYERTKFQGAVSSITHLLKMSIQNAQLSRGRTYVEPEARLEHEGIPNKGKGKSIRFKSTVSDI